MRHHWILAKPHSAVADTSETVPGKSWLELNNRDDQSTTLSIQVEKLELPITANGSKFRPKNEAHFIKAASLLKESFGSKFIKAAYRRIHFRDNGNGMGNS